MINFTNTITVDKPAGDVYAFLSDFENVPKWNYYVQSVEKISQGPNGEGTIYHQVRREDSQTYQVVEYRPNALITVKTKPGSHPSFERTFSLNAIKGRTKIIDDWKLELGSRGILERLAAPTVKKAVLANLSKMKELLEIGHTTLQDGRTVELSG